MYWPMGFEIFIVVTFFNSGSDDLYDVDPRFLFRAFLYVAHQ